MSSEDVMAPVNPYRCERCGGQDDTVRLYENGRPAHLGHDWRLMPLHQRCFRQWQGEADLGLTAWGRGRPHLVDGT